MTSVTCAYRASLFHFCDDPMQLGESALHFIEDGVLVVRDGLIIACAEQAEVLPTLDPAVAVIDYRPGVIMPGFIDSHAHYVQTEMVASPAANLLNWLEHYTFPAEAAFSDAQHARAVADFFLSQLLKHGTTTAMLFASSHARSVDALFESALELDMRLVAGKVMMDRNAPAVLLDDPVTAYEDSRTLIQRWHGRARLAYALTPRFAPTSSDEQLRLTGELFAERSGVYLQSHVAENPSEVGWVRELFAWSRSYLDVYDHFGLLGERALYAHGIYLDANDRQRLAETGTALAFCPSSNLFLGSGLLDVQAMSGQGVRLSLGSDVGAGPSVDMFRVMQDAYSVCQLRGAAMHPLYPLYLATLGGARALHLEAQVGRLQVGYEADFIVLDAQADEWLARRLSCTDSWLEMLFVLMMLGGQRTIRATYCHGIKHHDRETFDNRPD